MKQLILKLYDSDVGKDFGSLKLINYDTFEERLEYIQSQIFNVERYKAFYMKESPNYVDYWLGVKAVGKPHKTENSKHTLDYIAGYLLNAKDFDSKKIKKRFLELAERIDNGEATSEEKLELQGLEEDVLYKRKSRSYKLSKNFIFLRNHAYEKLLQDALEKYKRKEHKDYTDRYALKETEQQIERIEEIKHSVKKLASEITYFEDLNTHLKNEINEKYMSIKTNTDKKGSIISSIVGDANQIKSNNYEINVNKKMIEELYGDYYFITEGRVLKQ